MLRWALIVTGDLDDAEDVTQNVALAVHRRLPEFGAPSCFTTWLYAIVRTAAVDLRRKHGGRTYIAFDSDAAMTQLSARTDDQLILYARGSELADSFPFYDVVPAKAHDEREDREHRQLDVQVIEANGFEGADIADVESSLRAKWAQRKRMPITISLVTDQSEMMSTVTATMDKPVILGQGTAKGGAIILVLRPTVVRQ